MLLQFTFYSLVITTTFLAELFLLFVVGKAVNMDSSDDSSTSSCYFPDYFDLDDKNGFKYKKEYLEKVRKFLLQRKFPTETNCEFCYFSYYTKLIELLNNKKKLYKQAFYTDALSTYNILEDLFWKLENKEYDPHSEYFQIFEAELRKIIEKHDKISSCTFTVYTDLLYDAMIKIWPICGKTVPSMNNSHTSWNFSTETLPA